MSQCNSCLCEVGLHKLDQRVRELCLAGLIPCTSSLSLSLSHTYPLLSLQGIVPCVTSDNLSLAKVALLALHSCNCETVTKGRGEGEGPLWVPLRTGRYLVWGRGEVSGEGLHCCQLVCGCQSILLCVFPSTIRLRSRSLSLLLPTTKLAKLTSQANWLSVRLSAGHLEPRDGD